ncbi:hypothetical protein A3Q56_00200 [Intoshia linei]|uniref:Pericentrin/AKAP-450 centrosomal targeting domain-containing protein n=1 Tax=Intoshia linei TaxID=1819745 RepID=A0A177BCS5_9BILA|nr:hypothetical protein A3Q56_00200 [Intoshia linei]
MSMESESETVVTQSTYTSGNSQNKASSLVLTTIRKIMALLNILKGNGPLNVNYPQELDLNMKNFENNLKMYASNLSLIESTQEIEEGRKCATTHEMKTMLDADVPIQQKDFLLEVIETSFEGIDTIDLSYCSNDDPLDWDMKCTGYNETLNIGVDEIPDIMGWTCQKLLDTIHSSESQNNPKMLDSVIKFAFKDLSDLMIKGKFHEEKNYKIELSHTVNLLNEFETKLTNKIQSFEENCNSNLNNVHSKLNILRERLTLISSTKIIPDEIINHEKNISDLDLDFDEYEKYQDDISIDSALFENVSDLPMEIYQTSMRLNENVNQLLSNVMKKKDYDAECDSLRFKIKNLQMNSKQIHEELNSVKNDNRNLKQLEIHFNEIKNVNNDMKQNLDYLSIENNELQNYAHEFDNVKMENVKLLQVKSEFEKIYLEFEQFKNKTIDEMNNAQNIIKQLESLRKSREIEICTLNSHLSDSNQKNEDLSLKIKFLKQKHEEISSDMSLMRNGMDQLKEEYTCTIENLSKQVSIERDDKIYAEYCLKEVYEKMQDKMKTELSPASDKTSPVGSINKIEFSFSNNHKDTFNRHCFNFALYVREKSFKKCLQYQKKYIMSLIGGYRRSERKALKCLNNVIENQKNTTPQSTITNCNYIGNKYKSNHPFNHDTAKHRNVSKFRSTVFSIIFINRYD